jgi:DNA-binding NarL/FixJ family response regulator
VPDNDPARAYVAMCVAEESRAADGRVVELWDEAARRWRALQRPYELAESLLRAAEVRALTGDRTAAQSCIAEAYTIASSIGAASLADQITQLARQVRLDLALPTPQSRADADVVDSDALRRFGLTQREREVLAMVAMGRTNPEIAKHLFISPKTASVHVSNILAKLGVTSRVEAATMAHRLGIATS